MPGAGDLEVVPPRGLLGSVQIRVWPCSNGQSLSKFHARYILCAIFPASLSRSNWGPFKRNAYKGTCRIMRQNTCYVRIRLRTWDPIMFETLRRFMGYIYWKHAVVGATTTVVGFDCVYIRQYSRFMCCRIEDEVIGCQLRISELHAINRDSDLMLNENRNY